jgi:hypothetical protein
MAFPHDGVKFGQGQSREGNGRPAGSRNIKTILRELLDLPDVVTGLDGEKYTVTNLDAICVKLVKMAKDGDLASVDRVFDRLEGKPEQPNKNMNETVVKGELSVSSPELVAEAMKQFKGSL